ncbi:MAG: single-stranded-DNA-specific exonuclease RecJ [Magnetococcales bacterium]|nr:single-stranded-DNA-specific exonuclease RecJ [Magnetococcales bacterium]
MNPTGMKISGLSLLGRRWEQRSHAGLHHEHVARELGLSERLAPLLASRNLETVAVTKDFLRPTLSQLADPAGIRDMERAVSRIALALRQGEPIAIFGDYDVDGATSSALLVRYFRGLGITVRVYIPDRLEEGYGPNVPAMQRLATEGTRLIITVDCGISSFAAMDEAARLGMDVIITDHHQLVDERLPTATAIINPNRTDDPFPHKELAGVGLAFYLAMALNRFLRQQGWFHATRPEPDLKPLLELVAVGTVADVARLIGMNRLLVAVGLRDGRPVRNPGLQALIRQAGLGRSTEKGLSPGQIGFQLGPRINAGGRLGQGILGSELLSSDDPSRLGEIVQILESANRERQTIEQRILTEALKMVAEQDLMNRRLGWVLASPGWHPGVVGIVASRIAERFYRPTMVVAVDATKGEGKGSGRSVRGVDLFAAVSAVSELLTHFGGHRAAAGLTIAADRLDLFVEAFDQAVRTQNDPGLFQPALMFDATLHPAIVQQELVRQIQRFQPFGMGNPEPVFVLSRVRIETPSVLKERHVKCWLSDGQGGRIEAMGFGLLPGPLGDCLLAEQAPLDVAGTVSISHYRGREQVQFLIKDARLYASNT